MLETNPTVLPRKQQTLARPVQMSGIGIHTGQEVVLRMVPAPSGSGITFKRTDLPGKPTIPAHVDAVCDTSRCTTIGAGDALVHTVEHVMAALAAFGIDNLCVEVSAAEPPGAGGCSLPFVKLIHEAGIEKQAADSTPVYLREPVYYSQGETHLVALPSDELRFSYTLDYPQSVAIGSQYCSFALTAALFETEIAPCRTFALHEEIAALEKAGLIKGGSLDVAIVVKGETILNDGGLRYPNEMARHKTLDLIGDLALVGRPFRAHIIAVRSGHKTNVALATKLAQYFSKEMQG